MRADTRERFLRGFYISTAAESFYFSFSGATDTRFGLLGMSVLGFITGMHPLICMRYRLHAMNSSDSPLV